MGAKHDWTSLKGRLAGKWQIPLLAIALGLFAATIYRTQPAAPPVSFKEALAALDDRISHRQFLEAVLAGRELVGRQDLTDSQRNQVELRLGRARYGALGATAKPSAQVASQITRHFRAVSPGLESLTFTANDHVALSRLMAWQGHHQEAVSHLNSAIQSGHPLLDDFRKEVFLIHRDRLHAEPAVLIQELDELLTQIAAHRLDIRIWAVEERLYYAPADAEAWLNREAAHFEQSDFAAHFEFLRCRLLADRGENHEAEIRLRTLRNQLDATNEVSAMAGWLLGRVLTRSSDPRKWQEGLAFFSDVLQHARGPYAVASLIGQGEALARLERHEEAIGTYADAVQQMAGLEGHRAIGHDALRSSLAVTAEALRQQGDLAHALEYSGLAVRLSEQKEPVEKSIFVHPLALMEVQLADQISAREESDSRMKIDSIPSRLLHQAPEAARLYVSAARRFDELAGWNIHDEPRSADFSWKAAELFTRGGDFGEAVARYREFLAARPEDHRGPTALLRVGQLHYARGELEQAVGAFQDCHLRFPRSFDGARALVPLARAYISMGPARLDDAERALRQVLDDSDVFTPQAGEFVEALFLLGDVLERSERYEPAIGTLHEAILRYPDDPLVPRGRFLLGGAYRKSALAMRAEDREAIGASEWNRVHEESGRRLRAAREVYRELIDDLEFRPMAELDELEQMYLRHSYLYEADCYFETQGYRDALRLYEQAAGILRDSPRGLAAHVQMINCHVFMGNPREARAALARAMVEVNSMPDSAFASRVSTETRSEWKAYFEWLDDSEMF